MTDLFDAKEKRNADIKKSYNHASHEFIERAREVIINLNQNHFNADDIWEILLPKINSITSPADPRALGGVLNQLKRENLIFPTNMYVPSKRRHCAPIMVWSKKGI